MLPEDENEVRHKAFYCAIRSDDIQFIEALIGNWSDVGPIELDIILSTAYDELKLKNVPLSHEMENFVEKKLLDFRFFSNTAGQDHNIKNDLNKIKERINLTVEKINLLTGDYSKLEKVDEKFLFIVKFIAQNMHTLKRQLKSTYKILPWEEIEFCLVIFVSSHEKLQEMNLFYRATLNKHKILKYLGLFAEQLEQLVIKDHKLHCLPRLKREAVILDIISSNPKFEDLYDDYQQIRDVYSLQKISDYINLAVAADPHDKEGQLIITRALQVIGEHLKNTLESPKLSHITSQLLIQSLRTNARDIIVALRDSISHAESLSRRMEIENKANMDFLNIQNDLRKVYEAIIAILYNYKIKKIRILLETIVNSGNLDEVVEVLEELRTFKLDEIAITENFKILEHAKLESLVKKFYNEIEDMTNYEKKLFSEIDEIMNSTESHSQNKRFDYVAGSENLLNLSTLLSDNKINQNLLRVIKINAINALQNITLKIEPPGFQKILKLIFDVNDSVTSRKESDVFNEFCRVFWEIYYMLTFVIDRVKWIEELREKLKEADTFASKTVRNSNTKNLTEDDCKRQLQLKLSDLNNTLTKHSLHYKSERNLQAVLEMLLLDIMSILGISKHYLKNNAFFIDDNVPLLHGTCLRNHLAHDNAIVDILSDPSKAVIFNAKIISTKENIIMERKKTIGKLINDNPDKLRKKFHQDLVTIINQKDMFDSLTEGSLESFESYLRKGADIKARSANSRTTLHFAAMGPSLEVIKFILDRNISANIKDNDGETPLHTAAAHGRQNIVYFFIIEKGLHVDEVDNRGRTPLHVASQHGHKDTVEVLLKHKANAITQDSSGFSALHYAIRNHHIDIVKILLQKYVNDDINQIMGGFAPLHEAAETGNLAIVNLLLENKADVNAIGTRKNDVVPSPLHTPAINDHLEEDSVVKMYGHTPISEEREIYGFTPLHCAAENGHDDIVEKLLENGACVHATDKYHATPLHYAVSYGHRRVVDLLIKNNAKVNVTALKDRTPLHIAVWSGYLETVAALIDHGADIHAKDIHNNTPLHAAAVSGQHGIAELLINSGSDINARSNKNLTALHVAMLMGHENVAALIISKNADVNAQDDRGITSLLTAAIRGNTYIIDLLIKNNAEVNIRAVSGGTPLHGATLCGHIEAVGFLIKNKAEVNGRDNIGWTPLHLAAHKGHEDIVNLLIHSGAEVNSTDKFGSTSLHIAATAGKPNIIDILIKKNSNINIRDLKGKTPLHKATTNSQIEAIDLLIKNNAEVNVNDSNKWTPLHYAIENGHDNIVNLLIDGGAQVNAAENTGCRPLHLAATKGKASIINLLIRRNAEVNARDFDGRTPLHAAAVGCHNIPAVNALIKNNAELNAADNIGWTPLHCAALERNEDIINVLIDSGAQVNAADDTGCSLLYIAAITGNTSVADKLIKNNADVNIRNFMGMTPLHGAAIRSHMDTVQFLIKNNADVNATDNNGWTALNIAARVGLGDIANLLIDGGAQVDGAENSDGPPLYVSAIFGKTNIMDILIKNNAKVNIRAVYGRTPLHAATVAGHIEAVDFLIKCNAEVNATDSNGWTPLHFAAHEGYEDIVKLLIDNGAQIDTSANDGRSPLYIATQTGNENIIHLLRES